MRVHRSFIVNLDHVETVERGCIVFNKVRIPVSQQYKDDFQKFISDSYL
jgi:DNA-binding LytR/AlgR family response regulator